MPPIQGFWGEPTSTLDWCEENYEISYYIAEFWNTVSNLSIISAGFIGLYHSYKSKLEQRYILCYILMAVVGVGSFMFHCTLLYTTQLSDELPMIWASLVGLYTALEVNSVKPLNKSLVIKLSIACVLVCFFYILFREPLIHQVFYGSVVLYTTILDLQTKDAPMKMFCAGTLMFITAFVLWNIDNIYCSELANIRLNRGRIFHPLTQFHAWWHVLAGYASYMHIVFSSGARARFLKRKCSIKMGWTGLYLKDEGKSV